MDGFEVALVFRDLLTLLRNITAFLDAGRDGLDLHFAVDVRQEALLGQILIVGKLSCLHSRRLLHIAPCAHLLLHWLWWILLQLVHLINQHDILHIGNLIRRLLLHPLLLLRVLMLRLLLHLLWLGHLRLNILVYLLLRA